MNEWEITLVSLLSLKHEGIERVSEVQVRARRSAVEFVLRMLSLPSTPFEVTRLADLDQREGLQASRVVTMITGPPLQRFRELGYLTDTAIAGSEHQDGLFFAERPADHSWAGFQGRSSLFTSRQSDLELLQQCFPDHGVVAAASDANRSNLEVVAEPKTPLQRKINQQIQHCFGVLDIFQPDNWVNTKTSAFSTPGGKLTQLQVDAASSEPKATLDKLAY